MQNGDEVSSRINFAGRALWYTYIFKHWSATGVQNGVEAAPSIILAG